MNKILTSSVVRIIALIVVLGGAGVSLGLMLHIGRNNPSVTLVLLFAIWVLAPFMALLVANVLSKRWSVFTRVTLYILMLLLTVGSLVSYSGALSPPGTKPAFVFLVVPLISLVIIVTVIPLSEALSRRQSRRSDGI